MVGIYTFSNPYQLARTASGRFSSNEKSGPAVLSDYQRMGQDEGILQGFLEASSVSLGTEMTELLKAQRAFQISARIVQTADELEQTVNNLR
jgi:flagellar basal-body rod protein FlgG